jgi:hypothetical protein
LRYFRDENFKNWREAKYENYAKFVKKQCEELHMQNEQYLENLLASNVRDLEVGLPEVS